MSISQNPGRSSVQSAQVTETIEALTGVNVIETIKNLPAVKGAPKTKEEK